jgi:hypothetical protein
MADPVHPMALAMQWVSRIFAASLMMVAPGLGGQWIDRRWETGVFGPIGFVLGMVGGVAYLIAVTRQADRGRQESDGARAGGKARTRSRDRGARRPGDEPEPPQEH